MHVHKIQHLQNRAARILTSNHDWFTSVSSLLKQLEYYFNYFNALIVYKGFIGPNYMCNDYGGVRVRGTQGINRSHPVNIYIV